jgi:NAD(P)-dependent dehydrogenase (short-subunit alcohol dehydrogenase family)
LARIFITGSSDGLGLLAGNHLAELGHEVVLHARNGARADDTRRASPLAAAVIEGDVSTFAGATLVAAKANAIGVFDAVLHNVGVGYQESRRLETIDGVPLIFAVNVMAPYLLTALMHRPRRLVYLVRRQNIRHNSRRRLAECGHRLGVDVRRRACGAASADVRWSVA